MNSEIKKGRNLLVVFLGFSLLVPFVVYFLCFFLDNIFLVFLEFLVGVLFVWVYYVFSRHLCFKNDGGCRIFFFIILIEFGVLFSVFYRFFEIGFGLEILQGFLFLFLLNYFRRSR